MKKEIISSIIAFVALSVLTGCVNTHSNTIPTGDGVEQRGMLAKNTDGKEFGPQSSLDIDSTMVKIVLHLRCHLSLLK